MVGRMRGGRKLLYLPPHLTCNDVKAVPRRFRHAITKAIAR
jgi:hypothetical protein